MEPHSQPHDLLVALLLVQSLLERRSEAFFRPFGLTAAQFNILNLLAQHQGRMDQTALVDMLLVGKSSLSIVLNRMVRAGLVKRSAHPNDRRQTVLILCAKGRTLWKKSSPSYQAGVNEIFGVLNRPARETFLHNLETLYVALRQSDPSTVSNFPPTLKTMLVHLTSL